MPQPTPHRRLEDALRAMSWTEEGGRFALVGFPGPPAAADLELVAGPGPSQLVREADATTLLLPSGTAAAVLARHPGSQVEDDLVWIRLVAPMAWDLIGFLALVSGRLAAAGVPLGVVCSFHRDHLFVGEAHAPAAREVLGELFGPPEAPSRVDTGGERP